jgi:putative ABC transport system substrate-binding protein
MLGEAMRRREFIKHLVSVAAAWPFAARAQRSGKPPTIGYVVPGPATTKSLHDEFLMQRLSQLGWVVGRDVMVEYRFADGSIDRAGEAAAEFASMKVDVIFVGGDSEALAVKRAAITIPIVASPVGDPVGNGLIKELGAPRRQRHWRRSSAERDFW